MLGFPRMPIAIERVFKIHASESQGPMMPKRVNLVDPCGHPTQGLSWDIQWVVSWGFESQAVATGNDLLKEYRVEKQLKMLDVWNATMRTARLTHATCMIVNAFAKRTEVSQRNLAIVTVHNWAMLDETLSVASYHPMLTKKITPLV